MDFRRIIFPQKPVIFFCYISLLILISQTSCVDEFDDEIVKEQIIEPKVNNTLHKGTPPSQSQSESSEDNLLKNGGLEEWQSTYTPEMPKNWYLPSNSYVKRDNKIVYEGQYSAKMQSKESGVTARLAQLIPISPSHQIRIRFRYYVEQWKSKGARTYCYFRTDAAEKYNISADDLQTFYGKDAYYVIRGGGYGLTYFQHELNCWQTFDETIEVPPTANYFFFGINSYYGTIIYVDDCSIFDVTEQISTGIKEVHI